MQPPSGVEGWLRIGGSVEGYQQSNPIEIVQYAIENQIQEELALN